MMVTLMTAMSKVNTHPKSGCLSNYTVNVGAGCEGQNAELETDKEVNIEAQIAIVELEAGSRYRTCKSKVS
jgi:hypothetical protein